MSEQPKKHERPLTEEIVVAGSELVNSVKNMVAEGNIRRLIIRKSSGETLLEIPLTAGVVVGGALTILTPVLAALGAMAALLSEVKVEIVRSGNSDED